MNTAEIIEKIKSKGYWKVVIRPSEGYYNQSLLELASIEPLLRETKVKLSGWDYPHIQEIVAGGINHKSSTTDFAMLGYFEHWNFYRSGQFEHIFAMREDYIDTDERSHYALMFGDSSSKEEKKFLEIISTNYKITEIYLFASRLAAHKAFSDVGSFEIKIELYDVNGRILSFWDQSRALWQKYMCQFPEGKILLSRDIASQDLIEKFEFYALEDISTLMACFNWDADKGILAQDQSKLLERRA